MIAFYSFFWCNMKKITNAENGFKFLNYRKPFIWATCVFFFGRILCGMYKHISYLCVRRFNLLQRYTFYIIKTFFLNGKNKLVDNLIMSILLKFQPSSVTHKHTYTVRTWHNCCRNKFNTKSVSFIIDQTIFFGKQNLLF